MIKLNGRVLNFKTFPNGETLIDHLEILDVARKFEFNAVIFKYENDSDLIKLMFLKRYLEDYNINNVLLTIYYMPYSRMDRTENGSVFTLKYVSEFINNLNFYSVNIIEPHSDVTPALINKSSSYFVTFDIIKRVTNAVKFNKDNDFLLFPDATAQKRYGKVNGFKQLVGNKKRNFATGKIDSLEISGADDLTDCKVIIWDDLSSYGGTFLWSAEKLKELGASEIYLVVGHAENSIYDGKIFDTDLINKVYTTNTIIEGRENKKIRIYKMEEF